MSGPRRVLLTGGEGFIGANLAARLVADGDEVHVLSRPSAGRRWNLLDLLGAKATVHTVDLLDRDALASTVAALRPQEVFHLAGRVDLQRSSAMARLCIEENTLTTVNVLDAVQELPVESVIYTSSVEVYGGGPRPFREDQPLDPPSPYSVSKMAGEALCRLWATCFGCPVRIVRLAAVYGPGQSLDRLIPSVILGALRGGPITLRSPHHRRDYLFVADAVDGLLAVARAPLAPGTVLNLGGAVTHTILEFTTQLLRATGTPDVAVETGDPPPNEAPAWETDSSRARAAVGWEPRVGLGAGLARTVRWYRELLERGEL